jgi:hypothetical protein
MNKAAIVIGVNRTGGLTPLGSAADEADRVARWLSNEGFEVKKLTDAKRPVTSAAVVKAFQAIVTVPPRYHLLLVYFSGHGYWQSRSDIWLLSGAPAQTAEAINLRTAIDLAKYSGIPNVVFVSDACRSIPNVRAGAYVDGVAAFPNHDDIIAESKVDFIKATSEARPAYEGKIAGASRSVLTAALMAAFEEPDNDMVRQVVEDGRTIEVVPNRRLEAFLQRKVDALMAIVDPNASQQVVVNVPSSEDVYIARVRRPPRKPANALPGDAGSIAPPPPPPPDALAPTAGAGVRAVADAINKTLSPRSVARGGAGEPPLATDAGTEARLRRRMPDLQHDHFESQTGFFIQGAVAQRAVASRNHPELVAEVLDSGDGQSRPAVVRVRHVAATMVPQGQVVSVAVQFADRRCVVLAGLAGYIGHVAVKAEGVSNVSYVPSSNHWRWGEYLQRKDEVDRLRAMVALAIDSDVFHLRSEREAVALADRIRLYKGMDPTLGLYAAHAFSQAGNDRQVLSVLEYMRDDIGAELFDVRLLASRLLAKQGTTLPVVPLCPLLTQSWNLLRARRVELPALLQAAQPWLCDSLWTTFAAEAADGVFEAISRGDLL